MATRRGFFGFLAAAPLAAKEAADKVTADLAGIDVSGIKNDDGPSGFGGDVDTQSQAANWVKTFGLPDFAQRGIWENAKHVYRLDPDIAAKKSWSLAAKIHEQRQRNFAREVERVKNGGRTSLAKKAFKATAGFEWPWRH